MAKQVAGEYGLKTPEGTITLRLEIGTMMDLEDHFGIGGALILAEELTRVRMRTIAILYLAMTGGDWEDRDAQVEAATKIRDIGIDLVITGVSECIARVLMTDAQQSQADKATAGKPKAGKRAPRSK